jgi:hypothetical protein
MVYTNLQEQATGVFRTTNLIYNFRVTGLKPSTFHRVYLDGVDVTWASRQPGKDYGNRPQSDESGNMWLEILTQTDFPRVQNFELPTRRSVSFQTEQLTRGSASHTRVSNFIIFEIKSDDGTSYATFQAEQNVLLTNGPVQAVNPIE